MGVILDFGKWRRLHESMEELADTAASIEMSAADMGPSSSSRYKGLRGEAVYDALMSIKNRTEFWELSNAVGGIIKQLGPLDLGPSERNAVLSKVKFILDENKDRVVIDMYEKYAEKSWGEALWSAISTETETGSPQSLMGSEKSFTPISKEVGGFNLDDDYK